MKKTKEPRKPTKDPNPNGIVLLTLQYAVLERAARVFSWFEAQFS